MFGKFKKPKQVYLRCPFCGNQQMEPLMAVSSYCRECFEYFRIEKGKPIVKAGPRISGISEIPDHENSSAESDQKKIPVEEDIVAETEESATVDTWLRSPSGKNQRKARSLTSTFPTDDASAAETGAGAFFGLADASKTKDTGNDEESLGTDSKPTGALGQGSMSALIGDIVEDNEFGADKTRMPANFVHREGKPKKKNVNEIEVRCFRCNHLQNVSRYAASTQCERCSVYITMSDYEIKGERKNVLRTRGNVTVTRRGSVIDTELACRDFTSLGPVSAQLDCTGDVTFKHSGKVTGKVHCQHLVVAKKCKVEFLDGVIADSADIFGLVRGNVTCKDKITVGKTGVIDGDSRAEQVEVKGDGEISGAITEEQDIDVSVSTKSGFNSSIIN